MPNKDISNLLTLTLMLSSGAAIADKQVWQRSVQTIIEGEKQQQMGWFRRFKQKIRNPICK